MTTLPADTRYVALTRVMTTSLAAEAGFSVDEIDELRIAVDEIVTAVLEVTDDSATVEVRFTVDGDAFGVAVGSHSTVDLAAEADPLVRRILAAVTDRYELGVGSASVHRRLNGT